MGDSSHIKNMAAIGARIQGHTITQIALIDGKHNDKMNTV